MPPLPRIAVEGHLRKPDGTPMADATVTFTLSHTDSDLTTDTVVLAHPVNVRTNNEGFLRAELWANDRGFQNSHYAVEAVVREPGRGIPYTLGTIRVTEDGPTDLEQLLTEQVVRALTVDEQTLAAAVRAETAAQAARASEQAAADAVNPDVIRRETLAEAKPAFPLAPNLLADTKKFITLCGGRTDTETEIMEAHNGSFWTAAAPTQGETSGTLEVVTLPNLVAKGIALGGDLQLASNGVAANHGSDFRVVLMDVTIAADARPKQLTVLAQRNYGGTSDKFTGWEKGGFKTQAACFVNVVSQSGDIDFRPSENMSGQLIAGADLAGRGWTYLHNTRTGWGGYHQPRFHGAGSMKVALALPYIGTGDHGGAFIYAQSIGRYTHGDDRLPEGVKY